MPAARSGPDSSTAARERAPSVHAARSQPGALGTLNLKAAMQRVLQTLIRHHSVVRGMVTLLREGELQVEAVEGFEDRARSIRIKLGEGITGKVVESGKPIVVPRVSKEPTFLNLAPRRLDHQKQELTFICVPIMLNRQAVGALAVDLKFKPERDYDSSVKFFGIVSSMIGQALKVQRMVEEERHRLLDENTHLRQELRERYDFSNIIGTSGPMRQMCEQVAQVAQTNTTVLIRGESGTGKELIAHAIHYNSLRANKPFVKVSCAALPDTLIESELFGYEKGAFTGADTRKKGRFELAEGGTLFLDEIGDINLGTQVKLLRVLQEREFERLGGTETVKVNVRMIAATNKDMEKAIHDGTFREDLYYRLNVFTIFVPPLRERKADLLLLADHFLEKFSREHGKVIKRISTPAIDMLTELSLAGQRPRARERARARRARLRQRGHSRPSPAAVAADGGFVGHGHARVAEGRGRRLRARPDPRRAEDDEGEPRQGSAAARHDRADPELQGARLRHRRSPLQVAGVRTACHERTAAGDLREQASAS